ncbi:hypothetical protein PFHG_01924 [Plasmodium falciparum HB3]|uniref:tRNA:m(4)X modification enzyme TRM13 n=1 Tax=Plasmodium falciparum (isolate HB3) TaxID=137071 RepID=A0A0L7KB16_PLAFX|nr:hypothetical protein PFHG_01924 [Plasmodium falciparum HB3]
MEKLCPLENDCFIFPYKDNKYIKKHLKKCPLYIKNLYLHYTPFYFPYINDSNTYILKHKDVENMLNEYYILFNNIILDTIKKKMSIPIKTFDNFLYMKYNLLLIWYIKYGKDVFFSMLENDIYKEKLHNKLNNNINKSNIVDINIEEQNLLFYIHINKLKDIICNKRNIYNNNKERNPKYCVNEFVIQKNEISTPHIYNNNNICLEKDYNNYNTSNIHNYKITRDIINYVDVFIFRYPDFFDDEERKRKGAKRKKNDNNKKNDGNNNPNDGNNNPNDGNNNPNDGNNNQNDGNNNPNDGNNNQNDGNNNQNDDDYKNIFDETKNKTSFKLVEKNELDKDEILSIIIYLTIYLCCKLNIMKRIKNKNFNRKDMEKIKEKDIYSIFFFLNNLDKHDIQNINLLFLLVYFNNSFYVHFHNLLNQKEIFISSTHTNIQSLFIELGAGKANTTRWINFIMNNLGDILQKYNVNKGEPKNDDKKMSYINNDNNKKNDQHNILCTNEPSALLHPSQAAYEKCKMLIIEKESLRNKKEMKDFFMQIEHNNNENILRIRTNVSDFNLNKFIHFIKDKNVQENHFLVPDIIQFYYYNDIYKKIEKEKGKENKELNTKDEQSKYITHIKKFNSDKTSFISEEFLKNNLLCIESYLDINMKKLFTALTQGNNNLKKVYNNVNNFLKDLDFQKVTYLTKHLCGNGSDLALRYASCNVPEKKSIGKKIKLVIDLSRILYLLEEGLQNSYLIKYVNRHITLENYAIVFFNHQNLNLTNFKYF